MNRTVRTGQSRSVTSGFKAAGQLTARALLAAAVVMVALNLFVTDQSSPSRAGVSATGQLMQQMVWNPSPK